MEDRWGEGKCGSSSTTCVEPEVDRYLLQQLEEQEANLKRALSNFRERTALLDEHRPDLSNAEDALD